MELDRGFLFQITQRVVVNGMKTLASLVLRGILQWSVLGPLSLISFIKYMSEVVQSSIEMFAYDTSNFRLVNNPENAQLLRDDQDALGEWSNL